MHTNLKAPFFLVQTCLTALRNSKGSVINLIDIYSEKPLSNHPLYCASKAGLAALTRSWAKDLAPDVRVNGVSPAPFFGRKATALSTRVIRKRSSRRPRWPPPATPTTSPAPWCF